jgi:hypothetical protein
MKTQLPLALELSEPMQLAGDLEIQLCSNTRSTYQSASYNGQTGLQVDVSADIQVDDVLG